MQPRIFWTADEYRAIARALSPQYPKALTEGHVPGLNITDLNRAIRAALPLDRQRTMANQGHITSFIRRLHDTVDGKPIWTEKDFEQAKAVAPAAESQGTATGDWRKNPRVLWSADEWDALVRKLYENDPALEARFDWLNLAQLNEAASAMARPRRFYNVNATRAHLDAARARIKAAPRFTQDAAASVVSLGTETKQEDRIDPFGKVTWTREEWLRIAEELHRLYPTANYPKRGSLTGLETADVAFAQERALPFARQRRHLKVVSFATLKQPLERAFADLAAKLDSTRPDTPTLKAAPPPTSPPPAPVLRAADPLPAPAPAPEPVAAAPVITPAVVAPLVAAATLDAVNRYQAALAPLVSLMVEDVTAQVTAAMQPLIARMVAEAIARAPLPAAPVAAPAVPAAPIAQAAPAPVKHYGDEKPRVEKVKKLVVGVLVNRDSQYQAELEREFPQIEVKCVSADHKARIDTLAHADVIVGMVRFINHASVRKAKNLVGERYIDCNGAMSDLKRTIGIWLKTHEPAKRAA